jgi:hypothetical protein
MYKDVEIFEQWKVDKMSFTKYLLSLPGYSKTKTIDRIDGTKGYIPGNLRWATPKEQAFNRKTTVKVVFDGKEMCFAEFVRNYCQLASTQASILYKKGMSLQELAEKKPSGTGPKRKSVRHS